MHSYKLFTPIALTPGNFESFRALMQLQETGQLMPHHIADFADAHKRDAMIPIKGPQRLIQASRETPGAYTEMLMWRMPSVNERDPSKMTLLFLDIVPDGSDYAYVPRRWMVGSAVQAVFPYKMSCCPGLSALATYRQGGQIHPALLENAKFVTADYQDLFCLTKPGAQGIQVDEHGGLLSHWYDHVAGIDHQCHAHTHALTMPEKLALRI